MERRRRLNTSFLCRAPPPPRGRVGFRLDVSVNEREHRFARLPRRGGAWWLHLEREAGWRAGRASQRFVCVAQEQLEAVARLMRWRDTQGATCREIAQKQTPAVGASHASSPTRRCYEQFFHHMHLKHV